MAPNQPPSPPASAASPDPASTPALPVRSRDDSDIGWGEHPELDDDERFLRDRPPHWDGE